MYLHDLLGIPLSKKKGKPATSWSNTFVTPSPKKKKKVKLKRPKLGAKLLP